LFPLGHNVVVFLFFIISELFYEFFLRFKSEANSRENTIKHLFSQLEVERAAKEDERKQKDDVLTRYILYIDNILFEIDFCEGSP